MKLLFTILFAAPLLAYAQDPNTSDPKIKNKPQQYSCQELEVTVDGKTMILLRNVKIETENLTLTAERAVFNSENQTWIAYGTKEIIFNAAIVADENTVRCNDDVIRYQSGDRTVYLE